MEISEHIAVLQREGELFAEEAARTSLDSPIPTCPGWQMGDLIRHLGGIHRWAAAHVAERRSAPITGLDEAVGTWPHDAQLVHWFRDGHARLVGTLDAADPAVACWSFLRAPSPLAFWARRQAHETAIHRADAEAARGTVTPFQLAQAVDGIDELLFGFVSRPGGALRAEPARTLHIHAADAPGEWLVAIGPQGVEVSRGHGRGDCAIGGPVSDLFLLLWNRRTPDGLEVHGDASLLALWRDTVHIRWTGAPSHHSKA